MNNTFFYSPTDREGEAIILTGPETKHMITVLRLKKGDTARLIDGAGNAHWCEIVSVSPRQVVCRIIKSMKNGGEPARLVTLAIGLSTGFKFDTIIEKGTEIGVSRFVPLLCEKGKVKLEKPSAWSRRLSRWQRVARAAVKQSGRSVLPAIDEPVILSDFLVRCRAESTFLFHPEGKAGDYISTLLSFPGSETTIITGPESGFSSGELSAAQAGGINIFSLGDRILRTETAAIVIASLTVYIAGKVKP